MKSSNTATAVHHHHNHHHHHHRNTTTTNCQQSSNNIISNCASCHKPIKERFLLKALDKLWHEDCLKCSCCDCRLGEVGSTLFTKSNLILCKRDYLRLFGNTGFCSACNKTIPGFEMVMRAKSNVYHLECFSCFQCHQKFCVGDRFYLHENKILCEYDFEERMVFANLTRQNQMELMRHHQQAQQHQAQATLQQQQQQQLSQNFSHPNHHHHQKELLIIGQQQQQQPEALCDAASSGYGSGDSPFDH